MRSIALSFTNPALNERLHQLFPQADLLDLTLEQVEHAAARQQVSGLLVDEDALRDRGVTRLARLKARFPELAVIALVPATPGLLQPLLELGQAHVDALLQGFEDHPARIREAFDEAAISSVAQTVAHACQPIPPALAARNLQGAVARLQTLKGPASLAGALGLSLGHVRQDLASAAVFPPRLLFTWLRLMWSARKLGDTLDSVVRVARGVGYGSAAPMYHAYRRFMGTTPEELRQGGGLWVASGRLRAAVARYRAER